MKKKVGAFISAILIGGLLLTGCGGSQPAPAPAPAPSAPEAPALPSGYLEIRGSDTMVNMTQALAEVYMDDVNEEATLSVTGGGSGTGIAALINNDVQIALSSRDIKGSEIENAASNGVEVFEFVVGQDGVAMAINQANPVENLTMAQLKDILTGKITSWKDLGWAEGGDITIYSRQSSSGTYVFVNEVVMDGEDWAAGAMFMPGSSAIVEGVTNDVNALGYFGVGYVKDAIKAVNVAATEGGEYVTPLERANVDSGKYPIARPLYFYTNGAPEGLSLHYLQWVLSSDGQKVLADTGFYGLTPDYVKANEANLAKAGVK